MKVTEQIFYFPGINFDCNVFLIKDDSSGELTLIDCGTGFFFDRQIQRISQDGLDPQNISRVILTHVHFDHSGGLINFVREYSPEVNVFHLEADSIEKGGNGLLLAREFGLEFTPTKVHKRLKEGEIIKAGSFNLEVLNTPGHTKGSICLYDRNSKVLFSGDTVFTYGSFGRVDFPTGDSRQMIQSLIELSKLDVQYLLCGHLDIATKNANEQIKLSVKNARLWV
ncbi:MAG: MBL fold metallo-hydrolase [Candidatus Jordarchaeum sp.]|uniref:MBL fold metallo-hydrolase n=1 Tax=Candidatus Jordarchaeum sp. TaxID=2823881 RepID=UPI00404B18E4